MKNSIFGINRDPCRIPNMCSSSTVSIVKMEDLKNTKSKKKGYELFALATTSRTVVEGFEAQFSGVCRGDYLFSGNVVGTGDIQSYK